MTRTLALVIMLSSALAVADEARIPEASKPAPNRKPPPTGASAGSASSGGPGRAAGAPMDRDQDMRVMRPMPPPKPIVQKPAPEVAAFGKQYAGTWTCKGNTMRGDGSSTPLTASVSVRLDLDNAWVVTSLVEKSGPLKWTEYRTYDAVAKQWSRVQLANTSGYVVSTSLGEQGGKWTWTGTARSPNGSLELRDYEQADGKDGKAIKLWGEAMLGGSWTKLYEVTCRK
jgi:hypothetical protein